MAKVVTLGEIMLRLSTLAGTRIAQTQQFEAHYGGGEANVAISLANYAHEVTFASVLPDNALGRAAKEHLQRYNVDTSHLLMKGTRLGTYYMEAGVGERPANVIYDRLFSSFAETLENEWSSDLFQKVDVFHISGITPALSPRWQTLLIELVRTAKKNGAKISFDINYRGKLWSQQEASAFLKTLLPFVDFCSAGKLDALYLLGIPPQKSNTLEAELTYYYQHMQLLYPTISVFYSTTREVHSASSNSLTGSLWLDQQLYQSQTHVISPIVDRVGGGDAFSGGILHGLLTKKKPQDIVNFATAASALKHTIHGDCNQFSENEVIQFLEAESGKINR